MLRYKTGGALMIFACLFFVISFLFAEDSDITRQKICEQSKNIDYACKQFDVNPEYLKAIIYVERVNNYNWQDAYFDDYLAKKRTKQFHRILSDKDENGILD